MIEMLSDAEHHGPATAEDDPLISYREMARRAHLAPSTLHKYRSQGRLPDPDDASAPSRPRWRLSTFEAWLADRTSPGTRTDRHRKIEVGEDEGRARADDHVRILRLLAEPEARNTFDVWAELNPGPPCHDGRTREHKAWVNRHLEIYGFILDLANLDLLDRTADVVTGTEQLVLTDAGRTFLASR
ncbi:hypothetical protein MXD62_01590 [Frankia sp. Mgl5]|uniref:helix-turn-helix transcriptional regulator n=1 Tax=Frankia sp. Mgl5 TaxID=2933793 RepID=UPI00200FA569|nr:hypothetical protein [Frankia sp. Mgl5]MCK9925863.1 hypothetical protein [Frankia sp. Mgl5]